MGTTMWEFQKAQDAGVRLHGPKLVLPTSSSHCSAYDPGVARGNDGEE
jgi:hypothetical protein